MKIMVAAPLECMLSLQCPLIQTVELWCISNILNKLKTNKLNLFIKRRCEKHKS